MIENYKETLGYLSEEERKKELDILNRILGFEMELLNCCESDWVCIEKHNKVMEDTKDRIHLLINLDKDDTVTN